MDLFLDWEQSYQLNVTLLSVIGLWPYGNKLILRLKRLVGGLITFGSCIGQLATFITVDYTTRLLIKNASGIFIGCATFHKYISMLIVGDSIKRITKIMNDDFKEFANNEELRIIQKYVERGRFHTKGFAMFICPAGISMILCPLFSVFLDIVMPLNESRNRSFPIMFETFLDQQKYFFLTALLFDASNIVGSLTFVSSESLLIVYILHACALFEVTSHRIKRLLCAIEVKDSTRSSDVLVLAQVVKCHCRAIRQCKTITKDFLPSYIILLVFGILGLSVNLLHCTQTLASRDFLEFFISALFCFGIFGYMFYFNFVVQHLLNLSGGIFDDLYNTNWYAFPTSTRKLVLFCMLNSINPVTIDFSSLFDASYEGFSMIARMAMSYATALYSFQ